VAELIAPGYNDAKLIMHDFPGVPPYIDAMTTLVVGGATVMLFIRENFVFVTSKSEGILWEHSLNELFPASYEFNDQYFIDDIVRISDKHLYLAIGNTLCQFSLDRPQFWQKPFMFTNRGCHSLDTGGALAYIDAAMTIPRGRDTSIVVFNDWSVYEFSIVEFEVVSPRKSLRRVFYNPLLIHGLFVFGSRVSVRTSHLSRRSLPNHKSFRICFGRVSAQCTADSWSTANSMKRRTSRFWRKSTIQPNGL
jgi:hypothetical protein